MPIVPSLSIAEFAELLGMPLYPFQLRIAEAILSSIYERRGDIFTVLLARQSGKNYISALLEAYLLSTQTRGSIVKAAPTQSMHTLIGRARLLELLQRCTPSRHIWREGHMLVGVTPAGETPSRIFHTGPSVLFNSAARGSNVMGATASLLLEFDEAQDIAEEKFDRDFRPMAATTNATTVLYGTAWTEQTLLAVQIRRGRAMEEQVGYQLHFEEDYHAMAQEHPVYSAFVEGEIARLGYDHPAIQTRYLLHPIAPEGDVLTDAQQTLLQGTHRWEDNPQERDPDAIYVGGLDLAAHIPAPSDALMESDRDFVPPMSPAKAHRHDSTAFTIARVTHHASGLPALEVVHQYLWQDARYDEQMQAVETLVHAWKLQTLVVDATGLGMGLAAHLQSTCGQERIRPFTFTRRAKSQLVIDFLGMLGTGRISIYQPHHAPPYIVRETWQELLHARWHWTTSMTMSVSVPKHHDDLFMSLALTCHCLASRSPTP